MCIFYSFTFSYVVFLCTVFIYVEASKLVDLFLLQFSLFRSETKSRQDIRRFHQFIRYFAHQNVHLGI